MKRKWVTAIAGTAICVTVVSGIAVKPIITEQVLQTVTTELNQKINGSVAFSAANITWQGNVVLNDPVVKDNSGRLLLSGKRIDVSIGLFNALQSVVTSQDAVQAINEVQIEQPAIYLTQNNQGSWNVADLIKKSSSSQQMTFRGEVKINSGNVVAALSDGNKVTLSAVNAQFGFGNYPEINGNITAKLDNEDISVNGIYQSAYDYEATIKAHKIPITYLSSLIPADKQIELKGGSINDLRGKISQDRHGFHADGKMAIADGVLRAQGYDIDSVRGNIKINEKNAVITDGYAAIAGQPVYVAGEVTLNTDETVVNLLLRSDKFNLQEAVPSIPVVGAVSFKTNVWGTVSDIKAKGSVDLLSGTVQGISVDNGHSDFSYDGNKIIIPHMSADVFGGQIQGDGSYQADNKVFSGNIETKDVQLGEMFFLPVALAGQINGRICVIGTDGAITSAFGIVSGHDLYGKGLSLDTLQGQFSYENDIVTVPYFEGTKGNGGISGYGLYGGDSTSFHFSGSKLPLNMLNSLTNTSLDGEASFSADIIGSNPNITLQLAAANGHVNSAPFESLKGNIKSNGDDWQIDELYWKNGTGWHKVQGHVSRGENRTVDLSVQTHEIRAEELLNILGKKDIPFTGWMDNTILITGTLDEPQIRGRAHFWDGSVAGVLYDTIDADYGYSDNQILLNNMSIHAYNSTIVSEGIISEDKLDVRVFSKNIDSNRIFHKLPVGLDGSIVMDGHLTGTMANPYFEGNVYANAINVNKIPVTDLTASLYYDGNVINITDLSFKQASGDYVARGGVNLTSGTLFGTATVTDGDLGYLTKLFKLPVDMIQGKLSGSLEIGGTLARPEGSVKGSITSGTIGAHIIKSSDVDVNLAGRLISIKTLRLNVDDGTVAAQGTVDLDGPIAMEVGGQNVGVDVVMTLLKQNAPVSGALDFGLKATGTLDNPNADLSINLENGSYNNFGFDHFYGLANLRNRVININQAMLSKASYKLTAYGTVPLAAFTHDDKDDDSANSMKLRLNFDGADLGVLSLLVPMVPSAAGDTKGELVFTGNFANPKVVGGVTVNNGSITIKDVKKPMTNINGTLQFTGNTVSLQTAGTMGKGNFNFTSSASWQGHEVTAYTGNLDLNGIEVVNTYFTGPLTGKLAFQKGIKRPLLAGYIDLADDTISVPMGMEMGGESPNIGLDIAINAGKNVRLYNSLLYDLPIKGTVGFQGTSHFPHPSGTFTADKGSVRYLSTTFKVGTAKADFNQIGSFLPMITLNAKARSGQYRVMMDIHGTVSEMDLRLTSDPPLSQQQLISLLTFKNGGHGSSIGSKDVSSLLATGLQFTLFGSIENLAEKYLGLDYMNVTTGSIDPYATSTAESKNYYNIEMGKYLFTDFMVTASMGVNNKQNSYGIRYDLSNRVSINAWKNNQDNSYIGGEYRYTF